MKRIRRWAANRYLMRIAAEGLNEALGSSRAYVRMGTQAELAGGDGAGHKSQER